MTAQAYDAVLPAPFAALGLRLSAKRLAGLEFLPPQTPLQTNRQEIVEQIQFELASYFQDPGHRWCLPIDPVGTPYRKRVWQCIQGIPAGQSRTYGDLARDLTSSPRAIGQAVGDNPIPIVIPCHRVLGVNGMGGFMHATQGFPITVKMWLMQHEGLV